MDFENSQQGAQQGILLNENEPLIQNVEKMVAYAESIRQAKRGDAKTLNRHEGYGILAESYVLITGQMKMVKNGMSNYLDVLAGEDGDASENAMAIATNLENLIGSCLVMAAEAKKIAADLYDSSYESPEQPNLPFEGAE